MFATTPVASESPTARFSRRGVVACAVAVVAALTVLLLALDGAQAAPATEVDPWVDVTVSVYDAAGGELVAYRSTTDVIEVRAEVRTDNASSRVTAKITIAGHTDNTADDGVTDVIHCDRTTGDTTAMCLMEHQVTQADVDRGVSELTTVVEVRDASGTVAQSSTAQTVVSGSTDGVVTVSPDDATAEEGDSTVAEGDSASPADASVAVADGSTPTQIGFTVTNQGNVSLQGVTVTVIPTQGDEASVTDPVCPADNLAPGEQMVCTVQATATTLSGTLVGTVSVTATDGEGRVVQSADPVPFEAALPSAGAAVSTGGVLDHVTALDASTTPMWRWLMWVGVAGLVSVAVGAGASRRGAVRG